MIGRTAEYKRLDQCMAADETQKVVVFFDEMPWLDTPRSNFLPALEWFWNGWGNARKNFVFIICGSAASWMRKNIDANKGGLFNRLTCRIYLEPFTLRETEEYLISRNISWLRCLLSSVVSMDDLFEPANE